MFFLKVVCGITQDADKPLFTGVLSYTTNDLISTEHHIFTIDSIIQIQIQNVSWKDTLHYSESFIITVIIIFQHLCYPGLG